MVWRLFASNWMKTGTELRKILIFELIYKHKEKKIQKRPNVASDEERLDRHIERMNDIDWFYDEDKHQPFKHELLFFLQNINQFLMIVRSDRSF